MLSNRNNANSQAKNYIGFVNDHSGSMDRLARAAIVDYNANIGAIKTASDREMMDTVVSVVGIGLEPGYGGSNGGNTSGVRRQAVISNPHVLKPLTEWPCPGGTPLYDGIGEMIELFESLPDAKEPHVSFLVITTTDGQEAHSRRYNSTRITQRMRELQATGRWTFVFRVPEGQAHYITKLSIPRGNIQEWGTTQEGMAKSTAATTAAMDGYYAMRSAGQKSSTVFYANAGAVNTASLVDITQEVSLYVVDMADNGIEIQPFILKHRMEYLKGSAFYQLTKTEPRVQPSKMIAVRNRVDGKIYAGDDARKMLGLPNDRNVRLHPGDHGNFDLFIQSASVNRKLVGGTGVLYWKAIGKPFTEADLAYLKPKAQAPAVVELPKVAPTNKPTPSPLKPAGKVAAAIAAVVAGKPTPILPKDSGRVRFHIAPAGAAFYPNREVARYEADKVGKKQYDQGPTAPKGQRYYVA